MKNINWRQSSIELPPERKMVLIYTEDGDGRSGGVYLGGLVDGSWYYIAGLREALIQDYDVTWWCEIDDPPSATQNK